MYDLKDGRIKNRYTRGLKGRVDKGFSYIVDCGLGIVV